MVTIRELRREEAGILASIDRGERIDEEYALVDGRLELHQVDIDADGWNREELADFVGRLEALIDSGGVVLGAWDGDAIVGLGSLDLAPIGGDPAVLKLDMLYVGRSHRGHGVGHTLTAALADRARAHGASRLYISATPTRGTVDAYLAMGAAPVRGPNPDLFRLEPEDIHLVLPI